jgi:hypothetical protein
MNATSSSLAVTLSRSAASKRSLLGIALAVLTATAAHAAPADYSFDRYRAEQGADVSTLSPAYQSMLSAQRAPVGRIHANADLSFDRYRAQQGAPLETLSPAYRAAWALDHRDQSLSSDDSYARYRAEQGAPIDRQAKVLESTRASALGTTVAE